MIHHHPAHFSLQVMEHLTEDEEIKSGSVGEVRQQEEELQAEDDAEKDDEEPQGELQFLSTARRTAVTVYSLEIQATRVQFIKKRASEKGYPFLNEYDFRNDDKVESLLCACSCCAKERMYVCVSVCMKVWN